MLLNEQLNAWKMSLVFISNIQVIYSAHLRCYRESFEHFEEVPIEDPSQLINSTDPCVDVSKETIMFVFGYMGHPGGFAVSTLIPAFLTLGHNVLLVDWRKEAGGGLYGPLLGYPLKAAPGTDKVGKKLGQALLKLIGMGLKEDVHVVGHSLGAHLAGYAGRETQEGGFTIPWITALDPAGLKFETLARHKPIDPSSASFVDAVHCDPSGYAMNSSVGHVDFWPNYQQFMNGSRLQPGCERFASPLDMVVNGNFCNHNRCIELYNATLTHATALRAEAADDGNSWLTARGRAADSNYIGPAVDKTKRGNYFLKTTSEYPFGKAAG